MACSLVRSSSETRAGRSSNSRFGRRMGEKAALLMACFVLLSFCGQFLVAPGGGHENKKQGGPVTTLFTQAAQQQLDFEPRYGGDGATRYGGGGGGGSGASTTATSSTSFYRHHGQRPRILTLLTTYSNRTAYAKANREAMEERKDGYESVVSVCVLSSH